MGSYCITSFLFHEFFCSIFSIFLILKEKHYTALQNSHVWKKTVIGQTEFIIFPQCTQPTSHACIIYQYLHATCVNSDFVPCEIWQNFTAKYLAACSTHNTFGADKFESASRRKKINCLNFKKFFQLCISLLEMISILVDSFRFLSLVVIHIWFQSNLSLHMKREINVDQLKFALILVVWRILVPSWSFLLFKRNKKLVPRALLSYVSTREFSRSLEWRPDFWL